jgi:hypothetical protein
MGYVVTKKYALINLPEERSCYSFDFNEVPQSSLHYWEVVESLRDGTYWEVFRSLEISPKRVL